MSKPTKRSRNAKRSLFLGNADPNDEIPPPSATELDNKQQSNVVSETPEKKNHVVDQSFFSPIKGKAVVTPDKVEGGDDDEVQVVSPPLKKTRLSERFSSPEPKSKNEDCYVPTNIHKNLAYKRQGTASLSTKIRTIFQLVVDHHCIPEDFEHNRSYGPLSGISYEERVIGAYNRSMLEPKDAIGTAVEICSSCASIGHNRNDCPDLI